MGLGLRAWVGATVTRAWVGATVTLTPTLALTRMSKAVSSNVAAYACGPPSCSPRRPSSAAAARVGRAASHVSSTLTVVRLRS